MIRQNSSKESTSPQQIKQWQNEYQFQNSIIKKSLICISLCIYASQEVEHRQDNETKLKLCISSIKQLRNQSSFFSESKVEHYILVALYSHLLFLNWRNRNHEEAIKVLHEMMEQIKLKSDIEQALTILFGTKSLQALVNYDVTQHSQIKYHGLIKCKFYYLVAWLKRIGKLNQQAVKFFQRSYEQFEQLDPSTINQEQLQEKILVQLIQLNEKQYEQKYQKFQLAKTPKNINYNIFDEVRTFNVIVKELMKRERQLYGGYHQEYSQSVQQCQKKIFLLKKYIGFLILKVEGEKKNELKAALTQIQLQKRTEILLGLQRTKLYHQAQKKYHQAFKIFGVVALKTAFRIWKKGKPMSKQQYRQILLKKRKVKTLKTKLGDIQVRLCEKKQIVNFQDFKVLDSHFLKPVSDKEAASKIVKMCHSGQYVKKINFGNNSDATKFLRLSNDEVIWADFQKDIVDDASSCPLKDIKYIVYGKVTQNMCTKTNHEVDAWKCFSLGTKKRTYDFVCQLKKGKNEEDKKEYGSWLKGISYQLQEYHQDPSRYPYYSKGRMLWKRMLMKIQKQYEHYYKKKKKSFMFRMKNVQGILGMGEFLKNKGKKNDSHYF